MTILSQESLKSILEYLEKSINNLAVDGIDNLEIEGGIEGIKNFLENQFDIRLEKQQYSPSRIRNEKFSDTEKTGNHRKYFKTI